MNPPGATEPDGREGPLIESQDEFWRRFEETLRRLQAERLADLERQNRKMLKRLQAIERPGGLNEGPPRERRGWRLENGEWKWPQEYAPADTAAQTLTTDPVTATEAYTFTATAAATERRLPGDQRAAANAAAERTKGVYHRRDGAAGSEGL